MQITEQQRRQLAEDLPRDVVKTREQAGQRLSYVDGWYAVSRANEVFGPDGWSYATREIREVYRGTRPGRDGENTVIVYEAVVAVTALGITREDVGIGQCDASLKALAQGIEKARKEAVTDGLKRALRTFGPSFGLALYDKDQKDVGLSRAAMALRDALAASDDPDAFARDHADELRSLEADERDELRALLVARRHEVTAQAALRAAAQPATQPAAVTRDAFGALDASAQVVQAAEVRALAPPAAAEPAALVADIEVQVGRCGSVAQLADLWIAARADVARLPKAAQTRAWRIVGQRAQTLGSSAGAVRAEVTRRDTTPPDGPGGGQKPEAAPQHADAQGSAQEAAPAQGALAMVPAWCCDVESMERHVEGYAHAIAVERCARKHRTGLPRAARELLALRLQRLSWDPQDGEITIESARELVARWIAQGPVERGTRTSVATWVSDGVWASVTDAGRAAVTP